MIWSQNNRENEMVVSIFNLNKKEEAIIYDLSKEFDFVVGYVQNWKEIITIGANLVIANLDEISSEERVVLAKYYRDIEPSPDWIILTRAYPEFYGIKHVKVVEDNFYMKCAKEIFDVFLNESKQNHEKINNIIQYICLQRFIDNESGITLDNLSEKLIEEKSVVLDRIDDLRMAGAEIDIVDERVYCHLPVWDVFVRE